MLAAVEFVLAALGLLIVAAAAAVVVARRGRRRRDDHRHPVAADAVAAPIRWRPDPVRRHRLAIEAERAAAPAPADPAVAALVARVRDRYQMGTNTWDVNAAGVSRELIDAGDTGLLAAVWIVERSRVAFGWELAFWAAEAGLPVAVAMSDRSIAPRILARVSPYDNISGFHPRIHLVAAVELLAERPHPQAATPLTGLLEHWSAYAEHKLELSGLDVIVLDALVRCYRAGAGAAHPEFLIRLADAGVTRPVVDVDMVVSRTVVSDGRNDVTYLDPVREDQGRFDLSALARTAIDRADQPDPATQQDPVDLVSRLLALGVEHHTLLAPDGSEPRARVRRIGEALDKAGGMDLMLQAHAVVRQNLGGVRARELEVAWDGVGDWRG